MNRQLPLLGCLHHQEVGAGGGGCHDTLRGEHVEQLAEAVSDRLLAIGRKAGAARSGPSIRLPAWTTSTPGT